MPFNSAPARSVPQNAASEQSQTVGATKTTRPLREYRRANAELKAGETFNPFQLFDGAIVPTQILRCPDLLPSEKLVFSRLTQFAGAKGKAWPSLERLAAEVALSVPQTRRCLRGLELQGLLRRVGRAGRSNEFDFLWHRLYEAEEATAEVSAPPEPQSSVSAPPQSPTIDLPRSPVNAPGQSSVSGGPIMHDRGGRSPVIARRESLKSSSEEIQVEENQAATPATPPGSWHRIGDFIRSAVDDDDPGKKQRLPDTDPETELLLRLKERHGDAVNGTAILQAVQEELNWDAQSLRRFLEFESRQTTAPEKLTNPAGHYRTAARKFHQARAKQHESDRKEKRRALETTLVSHEAAKPTCSLSKCGGTGEVWDEDGFVTACSCHLGANLKPEVLVLFETLNQNRQALK